MLNDLQKNWSEFLKDTDENLSWIEELIDIVFDRESSIMEFIVKEFLPHNKRKLEYKTIKRSFEQYYNWESKKNLNFK